MALALTNMHNERGLLSTQEPFGAGIPRCDTLDAIGACNKK